ncbi:MAG: hypothetical protein ACREXM_00125 [Gammaproteobacteria bacterium]
MISSLRSSFSSARRRALCIASDGVSVYQWDKGGIADAFVFDVDDVGLANFERYLRETPKVPIYLMVDVVEEEYRHENIPHLYGSDRQAVIERKQAWFFRGTPYCHVMMQGREAEGRRDDKLMFTAIVNPDIVIPWVRLCTQNKVALAGIYSLPILSASLLAKMKVPSRHVLLVTMQGSSGLRQSFFNDRILKMSRLAKLPRLGTVPFAPYILGELGKFERYLTSVQLLKGEPLDTYILAHGESLDQLEQACRNTETVRYHLLDVADVARRLGIHGVLTTPFSDHIFVHLLLRTQPKNHFASNEERRYYTLHQTRAGLYAASVIALLGSALWSWFNLIEAVSVRQLARDAAQKATFYQARYDKEKGRLPPTAVSPADIKAAVDIVDTLTQHKAAPLGRMGVLGQALAGFPTLRLEEIQWTVSTDPQASAGAAAPQAPPVPRTGQTPSYYEIAEITANVYPFDGNYRAALDQINRFGDVLRSKYQAHSVTAANLPLDTRSSGQMRGDTKDLNIPEKAAFSLRVVFGAEDANG